MSKSIFVNQEIDPECVWINISKDKIVRAAVLFTICRPVKADICIGVYTLDNESVSFVKDLIECADEGENVRFYILEETDVETSEEG